MLPGDSLGDKIFEEGLKDADAVIVVVSKFSIAKKWVKEKLNASVVAKISKEVDHGAVLQTLGTALRR